MDMTYFLEKERNYNRRQQPGKSIIHEPSPCLNRCHSCDTAKPPRSTYLAQALGSTQFKVFDSQC